MDFESYKTEIQADVTECLSRMGVQPILFVGSGISQRYFGGPSWQQLLADLAEQCPNIDRDFAYYKQKYDSMPYIGSIFADSFQEWAWGEGRERFPEELFDESVPASAYIKHAVASHFEELVNSGRASELSEHFRNELESIKEIKPHALITTNYDRFLENQFPEYAPVIGESVIRTNYTSVGEIFKIHGCSSEPSSIILTNDDYEEFRLKKKYLSAKLLTFFSEHPLVFLGYSAEDPNIKDILSDIDEILAPAGDLIPNIYLVEWSPEAKESTNPPREKLIQIDDHRSIRVKRIVADDFQWVYDSFKTEGLTRPVDPKVLRSLLAQTYEFVRRDVHSKDFEVDFQILEQITSEDNGVATLYGITALDQPYKANAFFPYSLTQVAQALGYERWHAADRLLKIIKSEHNIDIKESDNRYHVTISTGTSSTSRTGKYSQEMVNLLTKVRDGKPYELNLERSSVRSSE